MDRLGDRIVVRCTYYEYGDGATVAIERFQNDERVACRVTNGGTDLEERFIQLARLVEFEHFPRLF